MSDPVVPLPPVAYYDFFKTNGLPRSAFEFRTEGPSMTRQEFAEECDINTIMSKYDAYLSDPMKSIREPRYVDFTEAPDTLLGFMSVLKQAETAFYNLPAVVRKEFDNDPVQFADYAANPENVEQMREWGLAPPAAVAEPPMKVEVVNTAPPSEPPGEAPKGK